MLHKMLSSTAARDAAEHAYISARMDGASVTEAQVAGEAAAEAVDSKLHTIPEPDDD